MRRVLADGLREQPYQCNCIIGAVDLPSTTLTIESEQQEEEESTSSSSTSSQNSVVATPHLYFLDYLGTLVDVPFTAQGYCGYMLYGLWDSIWKPNMDYDDGIRMLVQSINHMQKRFIVSQNNWVAKIVTKDGIKIIDIPHEAERLGIPFTRKVLSASAPTTTSSSSQ